MNRIKNFFKINLAKIVAVLVVLFLIGYACMQLGNALADFGFRTFNVDAQTNQINTVPTSAPLK